MPRLSFSRSSSWTDSKLSLAGAAPPRGGPTAVRLFGPTWTQLPVEKRISAEAPVPVLTASPGCRCMPKAAGREAPSAEQMVRELEELGFGILESVDHVPWVLREHQRWYRAFLNHCILARRGRD